jgi:hypothetical protein
MQTGARHHLPVTFWKDRNYTPASAMRTPSAAGSAIKKCSIIIGERPDRGLECGNTQQMKQRRGSQEQYANVITARSKTRHTR